MKKYSHNFIRDVIWYLSIRHLYDFPGRIIEVISDNSGIDGLRAFHIFDSQGKNVPTRHPKLLKSLLTTKSCVNLHIKTFAEDRASGILPREEFLSYSHLINAPDWFINAVENQKVKYYGNV